jgi:CBS domain-containing protein
MLKAKDIMRRDVMCIKRQTPACKAAELLVESDTTCLPVVEDDMTLVGVVGEKDLLRLFYADQDQKDSTVEPFMTQPPVCYREADSLRSIIDSMLASSFRRVPVISRDGKVVGIVSRSDVLAYIVHTTQAEFAVH